MAVNIRQLRFADLILAIAYIAALIMASVAGGVLTTQIALFLWALLEWWGWVILLLCGIVMAGIATYIMND